MSQADSLMRIEDLVTTASLEVTVLAGEGGLGREVLWAHSCEMPSPEQWLGPHELLMTVGLCVPHTPEAQREFLANLDEAGLAGLMIGDHDTLPPISTEMIDEANERHFPVLLAATETPYAVVARHIAAASSSSQILQVLGLSKLYQIVSAADDDAQSLVDDVAKLLRVGLSIEDRRTGSTVLRSAWTPAETSQTQIRRYPLKSRHQANLVTTEHAGEPIDSFILVHLMKVLEVTTDRVLTALTAREERGATGLSRLLAGTLTEDVETLLEAESVANGYRIAAFEAQAGAWVARTIALSSLPVLVGPGRTSWFMLFPEVHLQDVKDLVIPSQASFGVSSMFTDYRDVRSAAEEASRVHTVTQFSEQKWAEFEGSTIAVLSRSIQESEEIIAGVLGPLAEQTNAMEKLRETLFGFLRNDRHWQDTADELGIHRQTLSYRLGRIEEETGRSISKSADLSAFWIAYQSWITARDPHA